VCCYASLHVDPCLVFSQVLEAMACTCMLTHAWFSVRCWRPWPVHVCWPMPGFQSGVGGHGLYMYVDPCLVFCQVLEAMACTCMLTHAWFSVRCWRPWLEPGRRTWRRWHPPYLTTPTNSSSLMICDCLSTAIKSLFILRVCLLLVMLVLSVKVFIPQLMISSIIWRIGRDTGCPFAIGNLSLKLTNNIYWFDIEIQLNFVKANFIKTNNSLRRSKSSVQNQVLLILTKIQLLKSKYLCRTFYVSKHILRSRSGVFFHKIKWLSRTAVSQFSHLSTQTVVVDLWDDCVTIECSFTPISRSLRVTCNC